MKNKTEKILLEPSAKERVDEVSAVTKTREGVDAVLAVTKTAESLPDQPVKFNLVSDEPSRNGASISGIRIQQDSTSLKPGETSLENMIEYLFGDGERMADFLHIKDDDIGYGESSTKKMEQAAESLRKKLENPEYQKRIRQVYEKTRTAAEERSELHNELDELVRWR